VAPEVLEEPACLHWYPYDGNTLPNYLVSYPRTHQLYHSFFTFCRLLTLLYSSCHSSQSSYVQAFQTNDSYK